MKKQKKQENLHQSKKQQKQRKIKTLYISLWIIVLPIIILIIGFTPLQKLKDMFLVSSIIYLCFNILWIVAKDGQFKNIGKMRRNFMSTFNSYKTNDCNKQKNKINPIDNESLWIGVWISFSISLILTIISVLVNLYF